MTFFGPSNPLFSSRGTLPAGAARPAVPLFVIYPSKFSGTLRKTEFPGQPGIPYHFDGLAARNGFKAPERQISPLALDHQRLCLPGFVGLIAPALGCISTVRPISCMTVDWTRGLRWL